MKPVVGLTGGISSGKSTVANMFRALGVGVVDADVLAREVVAKGTEGLEKIVEVFGSEFLTNDGELDRKKLGDWIFRHPDDREKLNQIVHPRIADLSRIRLAALSQETSLPYVLYDAALLVEKEIHKRLAALIVVSAEPETQIRRLVARDGIAEHEARERLKAQLPLSVKVKVADFVIDNNGALSDTAHQVKNVHAALLQRFFGNPQSGMPGPAQAQ